MLNLGTICAGVVLKLGQVSVCMCVWGASVRPYDGKET